MRCPDRYQEPNDWKNPLDKWKTQIILYNRKKSSWHRNNHLQPSQFQCSHQLLRLPACQLFLDMFVMAFPWVVTFAPAWVTHLHPMLLALVSVSLELCLRLVDAAISTNHNWQSSVFFCWRLGTPYGHIIVFSHAGAASMCSGEKSHNQAWPSLSLPRFLSAFLPALDLGLWLLSATSRLPPGCCYSGLSLTLLRYPSIFIALGFACICGEEWSWTILAYNHATAPIIVTFLPILSLCYRTSLKVKSLFI